MRGDTTVTSSLTKNTENNRTPYYNYIREEAIQYLLIMHEPEFIFYLQDLSQ